MIAIGLFALLFVLKSSGTYFNKRFQLGFKMDFPHFVYYNLLNSIAATIFYLFSVNFRLDFDLTTAIIAAFYAIICFISLIIGITSLKHITLPLNSVMSISGSLIGSNCFGYFILKEKISIVRIIALVIIIISVILPAREVKVGKYKLGKNGFLYCIVVFFFGTVASVTSNLYLAFPTVDPKQYCTQTNIFLIIGSLLILIYYLIRKELNLVNLLTLFNVGELGIISSLSAINFLSSLVTIAILRITMVSVFSIASAAIGMIATLLISVFCYKEKLSLSQAFSLVLLLIATVICAF